MTVADVVSDAQGGFASGEKAVVGGLRHLRMNNIGSMNDLDLSLVRRVPTSKDAERYRLRKGDVVVCTTNSGRLVGKTALFNLEGAFAFSNHITRLRPRVDIMDPRFLSQYLWLTWRSGGFEGKCKHWVNQSTLPRDELLATRIAVPPLSEQRRLINKVDAIMARLDDCRARLDSAPGILNRFRQAVLVSAFCGRITERWRSYHRTKQHALALLERIRLARLKHAASSREVDRMTSPIQSLSVDVPGMAEIPKNWVGCTVGAIGVVRNGSTPSRAAMSLWNGDIPWVSSGEVRNSLITGTRERITDAGLKKCSSRLLPSGTVLLAMIGEGKTRGQTAILKIDAAINQNIAAIVLDHGLVSSEYLWHWFRYRYETTRTHGGGSGPQALNCGTVRELPVVLAPLSEQREIVRRVDALFRVADKVQERYERARAQVEQLRQSILAQAFRGELPGTRATRQKGRCP